MKTKIITALLVIIFIVPAKKSNGQYSNDSIGNKHRVRKVYPAIMTSPDRWNKPVERDVNGNIVIDNDDGSFQIDSNSVYFRLMQRNQRLPSSANWDDMNSDALLPGRGQSGSMHMKKRIE